MSTMLRATLAINRLYTKKVQLVVLPTSSMAMSTTTTSWRSLWITTVAAVFCRQHFVVQGLSPLSPIITCYHHRISLLQQPVATGVTFRSFATTLKSGKDAPPDFTIDDDGDDQVPRRQATSVEGSDRSSVQLPTRKSGGSSSKSDNYSWGDDDDEETGQRPKSRRNSKQPVEASGATASWMDRNARFSGVADEQPATTTIKRNTSGGQRRGSDFGGSGGGRDSKTFRQDFRGTRVFVQGLPPDCSWQTLKDHFRTAGQVVFASVSSDPVTGRSKGHGIVQFETTDEAANAIRIMRNFPLDGRHELYVREDVQENVDDKQLQDQPKGPTPPTKWKCANEEDASHLGDDAIKAIQQLLKARNQARHRRNYEASDAMREELRNEYGVQIDDRLCMWWTGGGAQVPQMVRDIKGEGRWGTAGGASATEWRQIPTTPENDACVNPDLVQGLLKQRDIARLEKDFGTADAFLEKARNAPDGDLCLRIHDESKTWRIWTEQAPKKPFVRHQQRDNETSSSGIVSSPAEQCIAICEQHAPEKVDEVRTLLEKFPGREFNILKKLKQRYL